MKKKNNFEKKYPLFLPYIEDELIQENMLSNKDLMRKYNEHNKVIKVFIKELSKRFDKETIAHIIKETIFKYSDEILLSFINAYFHSDEVTKNNANVVSFYNKTLHLGEECILYIEQYGIIANRKYQDLPNIALDNLYANLKMGNESFHEKSLDQLYSSLTIPQKKYVIALLKNKSFVLLDSLFWQFENSLGALLELLMANGINFMIINNDLSTFLGEYNLLKLIYILLDISDVALTNNIISLINNDRLELIKDLIETNIVGNLVDIDYKDLNGLSNQVIIEKLILKNDNLTKKDE